MEEWHEGRYYMGDEWEVRETVAVPANDDNGVVSSMSLDVGKEYKLKAYNTAWACNEPGCNIEFDAEYSTSDGINWVDGVAAPYNNFGVDLLDLMVNGNFINWDDDSSVNSDICIIIVFMEAECHCL